MRASSSLSGRPLTASAAAVVEARDQLGDVARLELREADDARADVIEDAVPRLGEVALALALALEDGAVLADDPGALDADHLALRRILQALHARLIDAA